MEEKKVAWADGMFLRAHLFQQQERYLEAYVEARSELVNRFAWGFKKFVLDTGLLTIGKVSLYDATGIFPDGTPFKIPTSVDQTPTLNIEEEDAGQVIYLATPIRQPQEVETVFDTEDYRGSLARYVAKDVELYDSSSASRGTQVSQLSSLRVRLFTEREKTDKWICLPIARIKSVLTTKEVVLEEDFVPPAITIKAHDWFKRWLQKITELSILRANTIAKNLSAQASRYHDAGEVADYLLLQLLNKTNAWLRLVADIEEIAPSELYEHLLVFDAELSTYVLTDTRLPAIIPKYSHVDPYTTFLPLFMSLQKALNQVLIRSAELLLFEEKSNGLRVAICEPSMMQSFMSLVLVVSASVPSETIINEFPSQAKIASPNYLPDLLRLHLPGVPLKQLPVPPRQIPYHTDCVYFELTQGSTNWDEIVTAGAVALHVAGQFPNLRLELWGVRALV